MIFLVPLLISASLAAPVQFHHKIQPELARAYRQKSTQDIMVFLKAEANLTSLNNKIKREVRHQLVYRTLVETAEDSQKDLISYLQTQNLKYRPFYITNMVFVKNVTPEQAQRIAARSDVRKILSNPKIVNNILPPPTREPGAVETSLTYIGAEKVWNELGIKGKGIVVAGQDTGVEWDHPAIKRQYRGYSEDRIDHNYNWHDAVHNSPSNPCGSDLKKPCDDNAHGTHTIGTIVGHDGDKNQIGVAPESQWIACRNMDKGYGTPVTYLECFEYFLAPYPYGGDPLKDGDVTKAPHIVNNSWSCPNSEGCDGDELLPVLEAYEKAGILNVVSAGNDGSRCRTIRNGPAHHSHAVLSVGALNHRTETIAGFSSRGPSAFDGMIGPHITAPGVNIRSAVPGKKYEQAGWSGTSMAGPHVAGQVALMWAANPKLIGDIQKTKEIIFRTAKKKDASTSCGEDVTSQPNNTYGYGIIDVYAAVKEALALK